MMGRIFSRATRAEATIGRRLVAIVATMALAAGAISVVAALPAGALVPDPLIVVDAGSNVVHSGGEDWSGNGDITLTIKRGNSARRGLRPPGHAPQPGTRKWPIQLESEPAEPAEPAEPLALVRHCPRRRGHRRQRLLGVDSHGALPLGRHVRRRDEDRGRQRALWRWTGPGSRRRQRTRQLDALQPDDDRRRDGWSLDRELHRPAVCSHRGLPRQRPRSVRAPEPGTQHCLRHERVRLRHRARRQSDRRQLAVAAGADRVGEPLVRAGLGSGLAARGHRRRSRSRTPTSPTPTSRSRCTPSTSSFRRTISSARRGASTWPPRARGPKAGAASSAPSRRPRSTSVPVQS